MSLRSRTRHQGRPGDHRSYRRRFLRDVHRLVGQGFQGIAHLELHDTEEPAITGLLTAAMDAFLDNPHSPKWTERYSVQDERHLNDSERQGKCRLRVDLELASSRYRPRPRFQIEAKRMRHPENASLSAYLGVDGLGAFLRNDYAKDEPWAGMMGYVQSATGEHWVNQIRARLLAPDNEFSLVPETEALEPANLDLQFPQVYRSDHLRKSAHSIEIHHFFLPCC